MSHTRRRFSVLLLVAVGSICAGHALGQMPEPAAPPSEATPVPPQVAPIEEHKLDQYAAACVAIEKIEQAAKTQLSAAKDAEAKQQIKTAAEQQIFQAVERSGLQLNEYNQIAELAARNEALRSRLNEKVERRRGG